MRSTFHGLETSKRGLFAQQTALQTTGHNISNANTVGYSRQTVNFVASSAIEVPGINNSTAPGQLGTGVDFSSINRVRETFLDDQYRNQNKALGDWTIRRDTLEKLETIVNEPSEYGIRSVLDEFWKSWEDLANQPDGLTERAVVMEKTLTLTNAFNDLGKKLGDLNRDLTENIKIKTDEANNLLTEVAKLNGEIFRIESLGDNANDLRDQRDVVTDQLSKLINIDVTNTSRGYTIKTGDTELVNFKTVGLLDANSLPADINSGEIYGYIESRDNYVASMQSEIDQMIKGLVEGEFTLTLPAGTVLPDGTTLTMSDGSVVTYSGAIGARTLSSDVAVKVQGINGLHKLGYTHQDPLQAGGDFFVTKDGSNNFTAANIMLNPDIENDIRNIATSSRTYMDGATEKVYKGNNELALWMGQMRHTLVDFDLSGSNPVVNGLGTFDDYFRSVVGRLGVKSQEAVRQSDNQRILVEQIESRRQSVSGVSLDEEMSNLIKFQQAYNASARMMTAIDEVLDKIINGMGVVGR